MDIREYLRNKGINWKEVSRPSGTQAIFNCPRCDDNKQKFAINLDSGAYQCFRKNECGISGSWWDFQKLYNDKPLPLDSDRNFIRKEKKYKKPQIKSDPRNDKLYEFFNKRKIKKDTVNYFKIGIKNQAIAIPHFFDKELIFVKYRSLEDKKFWNEEGCKPILFNMDNCINENTLRIFEGQFDVMAAHEYDLAGVSVPNGVSDLSWIENCWDFIDNFKYIYLFFDNDNAGQAAVKSIVNRLGSWRCYNVLLPEKDINDCLVKSIKSEKIYEAEKNAKEFDHYILKKANDFREDVKNHNKNYEKRYGYDIGFRGLNYILKGWREEEVTIIQGENGSGKSTIISQEILFQLTNMKKCCILSLELSPKRYLNWMVIQNNRSSHIDDDMIDKTFNFFGNNLYVINKTGEIDKELLFDVFKFAARKYGIKFFVIDSLMRIKFNHRYELNEQKDFIGDCKDFSTEFDCHVFIITHPRKGDGRNYKPNKMDIYGSSNIPNLTDNVLALWRPEDGKEDFDAELFVQKNREFGKQDSIKFLFNDDHKLYIEL